MLVELLRGTSRGDASTESLDRLADELENGGDSAGQRRAPDRIASRDGSPGASGLVFLDVGHGGDKGAVRAIGDDPVEGFDLGRPDEDSEAAWRRDTSAIDGIDLIDPALADDESVMPEIIVDGETIGFAEEQDIVEIEIDPFAAADPGGRSIDGFELVDSTLDAHAAGLPPDGPPIAQTYDTLDDAARAAPVPPEVDDLVFLDVDDDEIGVAPPADPAVLARDRARVLLEVGDRVGAVEALEAALEGFEATGRFEDALQAAHDLTRLEPDSVFRFQKRVELAYRSGRRDVMLDAYLQLADALQRSGGVEHALTVYRRVLEHDADNAEARDAIARLSAPEPPPPGESFVDLGSLILDEPQARDTRIRVDQAAPIEDEDQAFLEALEQFKRGIDENIDAEDFQAHYDLGIAFKEMGLLDEAIAQFQKALRSPEGRLKTSEQLGISFYDKGRFAIAEAVLRRAIDSLPGGDEDKIGLIYWLGRSVEAQRRHDEAVRCFERVLAVDIRFLDVGERVQRLTSEQQ
jgi:tetratricopeptide (TPR) repeat protein